MYLCACRLIFQFFAVARTLGPKIFKKTVGENRKNKVKDQILSLKKKHIMQRRYSGNLNCQDFMKNTVKKKIKRRK